jgi:hypothetical protein
MKKSVVILLTILMLFTLFQGALVRNMVKADSQPIWPMPGYNAQRTGQCQYDTSGNNGVWKWRYYITDNGNSWISSPAIASDGTIYVGSDNGLYAINPDGTIKWKLAGRSFNTSPAIASDGTIYLGIDYGFCAINNNGTQKWKIDGVFEYASPVVASDGTIYTLGFNNGVNSLYAVNPYGTVKWKFDGEFKDTSSFAVAPDGTIYANGKEYVYVINSDGTLKSRWNISAYSPVISQEGIIYLVSNYFIQALTPDGFLKWQWQVSIPAIIGRLNIVYHSDGIIYASQMGNPVVYAINKDGTTKWKTNLSVGTTDIMALAITGNNEIIISRGGGIAALKSDGSLKWKFLPHTIRNYPFNSITISKDGTIYTTCSDGYLYAIGNQDLVLPSAPQKLTGEQIGLTTKLTWLPSTQGTYPIAGYAIYRSTGIGSQNFDFLDTTIDISTTSYLDYSASPKVICNYYVVAFDNRNLPDDSLPSNIVSIGPDFTISISPTSQSIFRGSSTSFTVSLTSLYNFNSSVYLSTSTLPEGATVIFKPSSLIPPGSSTLTITTTTSTLPGLYDIKIEGSGMGESSIYHSLTLSLDVQTKLTQIIILQVGNKNFTVNGVTKTLDSPPIIKNSRTLLPIRAVVEALGGTAGWEPSLKIVTITLGSHNLSLQIDSSKAIVDGKFVQIDLTNSKVVPEIINSRTMLPLRFVTENLGCDVQWEQSTQTITITYPKS